MTDPAKTLLVGGTGKTGRRLASRLAARGVPTRIASRTGDHPFDWEEPAGWDAVLRGVSALYVAYAPDLAFPGAAPQLRELGIRARAAGVSRVVLLSGRGEPEAALAEDAIREAGVPLTVLRASWFAQNFSEGALLDAVLGGTIALPAGTTKEPFVDAEDLADVATLCLTTNGHEGATYDLTGPRLLGLDEVAREIAAASGRAVAYASVTGARFAELMSPHVGDDAAAFLGGLFERLFDGHNAHVSPDVARLLGRPARDFSAFVRDAAKAGAWSSPPERG